MADMPLMILGWFPFMLSTAPIDSIRRSTNQRWASNQRFGRRPAHQWCGPGTDSITLEGVLMPELTGGTLNLDALRAMADTGSAWILLSGIGDVWGTWFIESVEETRTFFAGPGLPRRIEFSLQLQRYDGDDSSLLGSLLDSLP